MLFIRSNSWSSALVAIRRQLLLRRGNQARAVKLGSQVGAAAIRGQKS